MKKSKIITLFVLAIVIILATVIYLFIENSKYYTLHTAILEIDLNRNIVIVEDKIRQYNGRFEKYIFSANKVKMLNNKGKKIKIDELSVGDSVDIDSKQEVYDWVEVPSLDSEDIKKIIVTKK